MLKAKFETCQPVDEFIHQKLLSLFFIYLIVGGMPDAVKIYIATKDIREVDKYNEISLRYTRRTSRNMKVKIRN